MLHHRLDTTHTPHLSSRHRSQHSYCSRPVRKQLVTVCRYDRRRSANNYLERTQDGRSGPSMGLLDGEEYRAANDTIGMLLLWHLEGYVQSHAYVLS